MSKGKHGSYPRDYSHKPEHTLVENLPQLTKLFPVSENGYFGEKGTGKVRRISSDNPLMTAGEFYLAATEGAVKRGPIIQHNTGPIPKSEAAIMKCGSRVQFRMVSRSDGTPVVEICVVKSGYVKPQKIHFTLKGGSK